MHTVLAARSDFSVGESILTVDMLVDQAKAAGQSVVALTDTMSVTALVDFSKKAQKEGVRPIIGCRLRLVDDPTWRPAQGEKKKHMPKASYLSAYVLTEEGMKSLFRMLTLANGDSRFYYEPKLGFEDLYKELDKIGRGDLAFVLGDEFGVVNRPDVGDIIAQLQARVDHVYLPLLPINTPHYGRVNAITVDLVKKGLCKPILIRPALYGKGEADAQEVMTAITENQKVTDGWFLSRFNRDLHILGAAEMVDQMRMVIDHLRRRGVTDVVDVFKAAALNTEEMVRLVSYDWRQAPNTLPVMAPDEFQAVVESCKKGWVERFSQPVFGHRPTDKDLVEVYKPRLAYELSILRKLNFSGYFLLVEDIVNFAKKNGILVGPGRGSVGGSLVAYLMGITDCDPIRFDLLFERFINPERIDLPDADLDFMSDRRHEIVDYMISKFGTDRVAGVSNMGTLASASSIRDVGRVTNLSEFEYSVSKMVPKIHGGNMPLPDCRKKVEEIDAFAKRNEALWAFMERLEGTIRNFSQHAAGMVVGGVDLVERAVVETRKGGTVVNWDKNMVEGQGLVKVDILGLRTLDVIKLTLDYVRERHKVALNLNRIPLDDEEVLKRFAAGRTTGVFQFESGGMRRLLRELGHDGKITFDDITACTALYRPGPMESGMMDSFYLRKQGNEPIDYDHPLMEPILRETFGVMVYQEQVMKISQVIAGYSGAAADKLRKIMGKKLPAEMAKERDKFCQGCVATIGCTEAWAGALFDKIEGFAGYGFNKSHSVEYTLISYQCLWLKVNYPVEFYSAALTLMDSDKLLPILRDATLEGITVQTPDINNSSDRFEILHDSLIVMPFQKIKGLTEKSAAAIVTARKSGPFKNKADFVARVEKRVCNVRAQEVLDKVGAFARIEPGQLPADHPDRVRDQLELIPGLISAHVKIDHSMHHDKFTKEAIASVVDEYRDKMSAIEGEGMPIKPHMGRKARVMIISDAPGSEEDGSGLMGLSRSNQAVLEAMAEVDLDMSDVYWTALVKRPKRGKQITLDEINLYKDYLDREIRILKPPVIVLLGSQTVRHFMPTFKGKASEAAGNVVYFPDLDANVVIGFAPGEIYFDPAKQTNMNEVFSSVATLLL